ncbi:MAG: DUF5134 domain-containing protein [Mycobacterium sp.]
MISDLALRWVVTVTFVLSAAECAVGVILGDRHWRRVIGQVLHIVMALAMAVMAWPRGAALPTIAPMLFFLLATAWYVGVVVAVADHRLVNGYHGAMMLAMAWMYAVMNGNLLPGQAPHGTHQMGMAMPDTHTHGGGYPAWITAINSFWTVGFALAALWWTYRFFEERRHRPTEPAYPFFGVACQSMMAAGMAIMFGVML